MKEPCGNYFTHDEAHADFDPECILCVEVNSDAPEWTLS